MSLVQSLSSNQLTRLNLMKRLENNRDGETFESLLRAIKSNRSCKDVYLGPYFYASLSEQSRSAFIRGLGRNLQQLRSLSIGTLEYTRASISGEAIGHCVSKAKHLHTLRVERDITLSSTEEIDIFVNGLRHHDTLQRVSLLSLHLMGTTSTTARSSSLDEILLSLSSITRLESLQLGVSPDCTADLSVTPSAVASIAQDCTKLSWLHMANFPLEDRHMFALFEAIGKERDSLRVLDFPQNKRLTVKSWKALWELLQMNEALESVNMWAPPWAKRSKELIYSFLALNRDGQRLRLRQCEDPWKWTEIAGRLTGRDLDILYTIVRENPLVCTAWSKPLI
mmetsp:Transcript_12044/g.23137  ORF Transcript_12044/g.23137 Transcript_12044/m.23137 type:complete len:338 (-) Transcript_12044:149-1162(-)|eukprot:scaffold3330_cov164-Amphora_coffeaeformis.AAC.9